MEEDAREAPHTLHDRFTNMMELLSITVTKDDEIIAEDLNCRSAEYSSGDDMENQEMCELQTPKISEVLDSISEVMNWMERQE
jgi:hypothetical protein